MCVRDLRRDAEAQADAGKTARLDRCHREQEEKRRTLCTGDMHQDAAERFCPDCRRPLELCACDPFATGDGSAEADEGEGA